MFSCSTSGLLYFTFSFFNSDSIFHQNFITIRFCSFDFQLCVSLIYFLHFTCFFIFAFSTVNFVSFESCVVNHIFLLNFFIFDLSLLFTFKKFLINFSIMIICFIFLTWFIFCFLNILIVYFHVHILYFIPTVQFNFEFDFLFFGISYSMPNRWSHQFDMSFSILI